MNLDLPGFTHHTKYGVEDGMPSLEVHCLLLDEQKELWIGTDQGLCRFDSEDWTVFTSLDGIPDNMVVKMKADEAGNIWCQGLKGNIFYVMAGSDSVRVPAFNAVFHEHPTYKVVDWSMTNDEDGLVTIYEVGTYAQYKEDPFNTRNNRLYRIENGQIVQHELLQPTPFQCINVTEPGHSVWMYNRAYTPGNEGVEIRQPSSSITELHTGLLLPGFPTPERSVAGKINFLSVNDDHLLLSLSNRIILIDLKDQEIISALELEAEVTEVYIDHKNNLWVGLNRGKGVLIYPNCNLEGDAIKALKGLSITAFHEEGESAFWIGTLEQGAIRFFNSAFKPLFPPETSGSLSRIKAEGNEVTAIWNRTTGYRLIQNDIGHWQWKPMIESKHLTDFWCFSDTCLASADLRDVQLITIVNDTNHLEELRQLSPMTFIKCGGPRLFGYSSGTGFFYYNLSQKQNLYNSFEYDIIFRNNDATHYKRDTVLLASAYGLKKAYVGGCSQFIEHILPSSTYVYKVLMDKDRNIWFATKGQGVYWVSSDLKKHMVFSRENGLAQNSVYDICIAKNQLYGATNNGLFVIDGIEGSHENFKLKLLGNSNGIPEGIKELAVSSQHLFINSNGALRVARLDELVKSFEDPPVHLKQARVNNEISDTARLKHLASDENNIDIKFGMSEFGRKNLRYWYLFDQKPPWIRIEQNELSFKDLKPGQHELVVSNRPEIIEGKSLILPFNIYKPFTQSLWFQILLFALGAGLVSLVFWFFLSRARLNNRLLQSQQIALTSQMNPHFIFNALNSVSHYVGMGSKSLAQSYLGDFAVLMRQVLDSSRSGEISLQKEIETLQTYIRLEGIRFDTVFESDIVVDPALGNRLGNISIPSMIIQPYVENAILHGLRPLESGGRLEIAFNWVYKSVQVIVRDNGIGRKAAMALWEQKDHRSHGMSITGQRIQLLNKKRKNKITAVVNDVEPTGTEVVLTIPIDTALL